MIKNSISNRLTQKNWIRLILFTYFFLGAFALVSQTLILREFYVVVYGNEFIFGVLLTNWLIGIFSGTYLGGIISEKSSNNLSLFVISILIMVFLLPVSITSIRFLYAISHTPPGTYIRFFNVFLYSALIIIPISFFIGFVFPAAAKVHIRFMESTGETPGKINKPNPVKSISRIYILEAIGSLVSGILFTFLLVGKFNSYIIIAAATLPLLISGCIISLKSAKRKPVIMAIILLIATLISLWPSVNKKIETWTTRERWRSFSTLPLVYSVDSKYQNIGVAELSGQYNVFLNTTFAFAFPNDDDNMVLAANLICQHPEPKRILIIGDALSGLAKFLLKYNISELVSVEIDPAVINTTLKFLPEEDKQILLDKRFKILLQDGRKYIDDLIKTNEKGKDINFLSPNFDIVFIDVPEPSTLLLNRYYSREFFQALSKVMNPGGVVSLRATSSETYTHGIITQYTASVYRTLKSVFPEIVITPGMVNFLFASQTPGSVSDNPQVLGQRYENSRMEPHKLRVVFRSLFPETQTRDMKQTLDSMIDIPLNTDETPIACLYYNKIIGWYGESNIAGILEFFEQLKVRDVIFLVLLLFFIRLLIITISRKKQAAGKFLKFHTLTSVFSMGMTGLSFELVLLYMFQKDFGNIYYIVGFITAVFMFGLPLGAASANRFLSNPKKPGSKVVFCLILTQIATAIVAVFMPGLIRFVQHIELINYAIIFGSAMIIGFFVGMVFPLAIHLYITKNSNQAGKTAGVINAMDHIGAALGAFFIGSFFLPVIGVQKSCFLIALFPLISASLLFTDWLRLRKSN